MLCYAILYYTILYYTILYFATFGESLRWTSSVTSSSHHNIFPHKILSKGWVAQKPFLIGSLTAALRFSKGWVRKDLNLVMGIGCRAM